MAQAVVTLHAKPLLNFSHPWTARVGCKTLCTRWKSAKGRPCPGSARYLRASASVYNCTAATSVSTVKYCTILKAYRSCKRSHGKALAWPVSKHDRLAQYNKPSAPNKSMFYSIIAMMLTLIPNALNLTLCG